MGIFDRLFGDGLSETLKQQLQSVFEQQHFPYMTSSLASLNAVSNLKLKKASSASSSAGPIPHAHNTANLAHTCNNFC